MRLPARGSLPWMRQGMQRPARRHGLAGPTVGLQRGLGPTQHRVGSRARRTGLAIPYACQQLHAFTHPIGRVHMKPPRAHSLDRLGRQHQVATVAPRNQHALSTVQPQALASI